MTPTGEFIHWYDRRPSVQFNLPRQVAVRAGRKMFAGRAQPRFVCEDDPKLLECANALRREGFLDQRMLHASVWGFVGSVAVSFRILVAQADNARIVLDVWRAKHCVPQFDALGELQLLRLQYVTGGQEFLGSGQKRDCWNEPVDPTLEYWFVRDLTPELEVCYRPIPVDDW